MLRVELSNAKPGMKLAMPVRHPRFFRQTLLKFDYALEACTIAKMGSLGIKHIWVQYPNLAFLAQKINPAVIATQGRMVEQIATTFQRVQSQSSAKMPLDAYIGSITELVSDLVSNPQSAVFLGDLSSCDGDDLMRHSSSVTYLSLLMGLKLEGYLIRQRRHIDPGRAKEVVSLGLGAMLHDIGITQLPVEVRRRYARSADENDPAWREHPSMGYAMVRGKIVPSAATVVLNHHQRFDGSGYAGSETPVLEGQRIHIFARIVGLAEQFDRMRNPPHLPAQPTVFVLAALLEKAMSARFDPQVILALLTVVPPYPPGSIVRLSDQRWAVAIDHTPVDPCRPTVQIIPAPSRLDSAAGAGAVLDLSQHSRSLFVAEADGRDVTEFNFAPPALAESELVLNR